MLGAKAESDFSNAHTQQEAEQAERAMKEAAAALKVCVTQCMLM
jgi:predicted NAD/FAD-dependent oxidoreductase